MTAERILGVEGGGTKTAWTLVERRADGLATLERGTLPPSNFRLSSADHLRGIFSALPPDVARVGVFLAGCATPEDQRALTTLCSERWPRARIITGSDRDSGMAAALGSSDGIVVNAGTGSSVTGRRGDRSEKAGGWGHILGDAGGGYYLAVQALRLLLRDFDLRGGRTDAAADILRALCLNSLDELVRWVQAAGKTEIASLAPIVVAAAGSGDTRMLEILNSAARVLAEYTEAVARRLEFVTPEVKLIGSVFQGCRPYAEAFERELINLVPRARVAGTDRPPEFGAAWLAAGADAPLSFRPAPPVHSKGALLAAAATEQRNRRSANLDRLSAAEIAELFAHEEQFVQHALRDCSGDLGRAIELVASALKAGGRLFYMGAGTSGRLGVLDASEIPPTFGASPELVQGIMAGGVTALHRSVEGAEDNAGAGALALEGRSVTAADVVCGIAASGRTPFVLGALARAQEIGATTILLTCNPERTREGNWDLEIDLSTGPELLTGSTRLKAGTATKVALNIISTGAMVMMGKVRGNLMIDVVASNEKLRDRATRLVAELAPCDYAEAGARLAANGWSVRAALNGSEAR
ncbi:MAG: N-acetylmuramic acid 6-phosphate etherase [uncultured Chthoniobacterales bacterium]|uniref:N-acetylmuramic acid 6-phosphate etherase n=1 Tax=uncultured Chthoniobacterales bacterium TaxID=1836801 RepID=A0A6J4HKP5_9BACT|nr:MAG: N-acetylmuramic acid 6-phosphate etherase [uncultured Chthoniobacterales bacterium]